MAASNERDGGVRLVVLTKAGARILGEGESAFQPTASHLLAPQTDRQQRDLLQLVAKI